MHQYPSQCFVQDKYWQKKLWYHKPDTPRGMSTSHGADNSHWYWYWKLKWKYSHSFWKNKYIASISRLDLDQQSWSWSDIHRKCGLIKFLHAYICTNAHLLHCFIFITMHSLDKMLPLPEVIGYNIFLHYKQVRACCLWFVSFRYESQAHILMIHCPKKQVLKIIRKIIVSTCSFAP